MKEKTKIDIGFEIYNKFAKQFATEYVTPRTNTCEMFAILREEGHIDLLVREMMKEFLTNLPEDEIVLKNGQVLYKKTHLVKIIK